MNRKCTQAFTLIELLAVMTIILVLAGLFVGVSGPASQSAKKRKAEVMISALEVAISMYHADTGSYPINNGGWTSASLYEYLVDPDNKYCAGGSAPIPGWAGPYMEFKGGDVNASREILDPWGTPYNYNANPAYNPNNKNSFDMWSYGPDKTNDFGWDDDIRNW